jgi:hypothetical protein
MTASRHSAASSGAAALCYIGRPAHVARGDRQQTAPVGDAQRHGIDGLREPPLELLDARVQILRLVHDQSAPVPRMPRQVVAERRRGAEHSQQPVTQRLRRYQRVEQLPPGCALGLRLEHPYEPEQRLIGVGGRAEGVQQYGIGADGRQFGAVEQPLGGGRVGETVPQQPCEGTAPPPLRHVHLAVSRSIKVVRLEPNRSAARKRLCAVGIRESVWSRSEDPGMWPKSDSC